MLNWASQSFTLHLPKEAPLSHLETTLPHLVPCIRNHVERHTFEKKREDEIIVVSGSATHL